MPTLDLDNESAARTEALGETPAVKFRGETYTLPSELPFGVFMRLRDIQRDPTTALDAMDLLLGALFGDRKDEFLDAGASLDDVKALMEGLTDTYGISVGESSASGSS